MQPVEQKRYYLAKTIFLCSTSVFVGYDLIPYK